MSASSLNGVSYLLSLALPIRHHKFLPLVRWETPLLPKPKTLPHEFFFYAARRSEPAPSKSARRVLRSLGGNRVLLYVQALIWVPVWLGVLELTSREGARIPGLGVRIPLPEVWVRDWEVRETERRERGRKRVAVRVVRDGVGRREYYDPRPGSILGRVWEEDQIQGPNVEKRESWEYLGEVF